MTKDERVARDRAYRITKKDEIAAQKRIYTQANRIVIANKRRIYYQVNKIEIADRQRIYQKTNKIKMAAYKKIYNKANRPRVNARAVARRKTDVEFRLSRLLRCRMQNALKGRYKTGRTVAELGCTSVELRAYIESLFETGMSWSNYGIGKDQWSIDHIVPVSSADLTNRDEYLKISNFKNLQPMWHVLNVAKANSTDILLIKGGSL